MTATLLTSRCPCHILPQPERAGMAPLPFDQAGEGYGEAHPRPLARRALHVKLPAELESPLPHGLPAYTDGGPLWIEPTSVVGHLDVGELAVETQLYPNVVGLGVASDVRERLLDEARELLACLVGEPGRKIVLYQQFEFVPSTGHPPVQVHEVLERGDQRAVQRLVETQLEDGAAQSLYGALEGLGRVLESRTMVSLRDDLHDPYLLQRVDDVLKGAVVEFSGQPVAFGFPYLFQHALSPLALRHIVGDDAHGLLAVVWHGAHVDLDVGQRSVLAPVLQLTQGKVPLLQNASDVEVYALLIVGDDIVDRHLFQLLVRVAQRAEEGIVGVEHSPALRVDEEDVLLGLLDHRAIERLALLEGLLLVLALRQVYNGGHPDPAPRVGQVPRPHLYGEGGAVLL